MTIIGTREAEQIRRLYLSGTSIEDLMDAFDQPRRIIRYHIGEGKPEFEKPKPWIEDKAKREKMVKALGAQKGKSMKDIAYYNYLRGECSRAHYESYFEVD